MLNCGVNIWVEFPGFILTMKSKLYWLLGNKYLYTNMI